MLLGLDNVESRFKSVPENHNESDVEVEAQAFVAYHQPPFRPPRLSTRRDIRRKMTSTTAIAPLDHGSNGESSRVAAKMEGNWMPCEGGIATYHTFIPPPLPSAPSFHLHLTRMKDTLFIWVGNGSEGSEEEESTGSTGEKRLASDWAVAMPTRGVSTNTTDHFVSGI